MRADFFGLLAVMVLVASAAAAFAFPHVSMRSAPMAKTSPDRQIESIAVEPSGIVPETPLTPRALARFFSHSFSVPVVSEKTPEPIALEPSAPAVLEAHWMKPLGTITDAEGSSRLYFKDTRTGRLYRFRVDGTPELELALLETRADRYLVSIDGIRYFVKRAP